MSWTITVQRSNNAYLDIKDLKFNVALRTHLDKASMTDALWFAEYISTLVNVQCYNKYYTKLLNPYVIYKEINLILQLYMYNLLGFPSHRNIDCTKYPYPRLEPCFPSRHSSDRKRHLRLEHVLSLTKIEFLIQKVWSFEAHPDFVRKNYL